MLYPNTPPVLPDGPVTLYNLTGEWGMSEQFSSPRTRDLPRFCETPVLTSCELEERFAAHLRTTLSVSEHFEGDPMRCFIPRHGLGFGTAANRLDMLICLECHSLYFWKDSERHFRPLSTHALGQLAMVFSAARIDLIGLTGPQILERFTTSLPHETRSI
jgi:hypothetical protein